MFHRCFSCFFECCRLRREHDAQSGDSGSSRIRKIFVEPKFVLTIGELSHRWGGSNAAKQPSTAICRCFGDQCSVRRCGGAAKRSICELPIHGTALRRFTACMSIGDWSIDEREILFDLPLKRSVADYHLSEDSFLQGSTCSATTLFQRVYVWKG